VQAKDHVYDRDMRVLLGTIALLAIASCDPPPPNYAQYRYGNDPSQNPNPPPTYSNDPNAPPSTYPQPNQPPPPQPGELPPPNYNSGGYTTTVVPPPPSQNSAPPPMSGGYTTTVVPPQNAAPPPNAPPASYPPPPPSSDGGAIALGQYTCFQVGMGGYVASSLVSVTLNADGSYQVAGYNNAGGSYRADTVAVYLNGGPLNGWIGAIGANAKGPLVRFRPAAPNNPGREMGQGDQLCFLRF
jgi:hypothetical protein